MIDLLQDMDRFATSQDSYDHSIAAQALLATSWSFVREYRQQSNTTKDMPSQWNNGRLLLVPRLKELEQLLDCLRMGSGSTPATVIAIEVQSMHLYINLGDVHIFAGIEGYTEARRVCPILSDWAGTAVARHAIWHAGQILRSAGQISAIRDFEAVAVYQAALTIWAYSVISTAKQQPASSELRAPTAMLAMEDEDLVAINEIETEATQRYLALGQGRPAISVAAGSSGIEHTTERDTDAKRFVPLSDPAGVMTAIIELLSSSHPSQQSRLWLVENLLKLMADLRAAVIGGPT